MIRPVNANRSDLNKLCSLYATKTDCPMTRDSLRVLRELVLDKKTIIILYSEEGKDVGTATLSMRRVLTHGATPIAHIDNIVCTSEDNESLIIGEMISFLKDIAIKKSCNKVTIHGSESDKYFYKSLELYPSDDIVFTDKEY